MTDGDSLPLIELEVGQQEGLAADERFGLVLALQICVYFVFVLARQLLPLFPSLEDVVRALDVLLLELGRCEVGRLLLLAPAQDQQLLQLLLVRTELDIRTFLYEGLQSLAAHDVPVTDGDRWEVDGVLVLKGSAHVHRVAEVVLHQLGQVVQSQRHQEEEDGQPDHQPRPVLGPTSVVDALDVGVPPELPHDVPILVRVDGRGMDQPPLLHSVYGELDGESRERNK